MSVRALRRLVIGVCLGGIVGMIVSSITNHNAVALTFGIVTAMAILCSMVATTVTGQGTAVVPAKVDVDAQAVEDHAGVLIEAGADEQSVRDLIRAAVRFGRSSGPF